MAKTDAPTPPVSFEAAVAELEAIVRTMEAGEAPLEDSLAAYERGMALLTFCQQTLSAAEQKLQILEDGALAAFDPDRQGTGEE